MFSLKRQQYQYMVVDKTYCVHSSIKYNLQDLNTKKYYQVSLTQGLEIIEVRPGFDDDQCPEGEECPSSGTCVTQGTKTCKNNTVWCCKLPPSPPTPAPPTPPPTPAPPTCSDYTNEKDCTSQKLCPPPTQLFAQSDCSNGNCPPKPTPASGPGSGSSCQWDGSSCCCGSGPCSTGYGQLLLAYYSGPYGDSLTSSSNPMNALSLAFFDPALFAQSGCDFTGDSSPCLKAASGAGDQVSLKWAKATITSMTVYLKKNLTPGMKKPIYFISFGGQAASGSGWDIVFNDAAKAATFGTNAAALVKQIETDTKGVATIGIDLDTEGVSEMKNFEALVKAFRADAPFDKYPLMMCAFSSLQCSTSAENFKSDLFNKYGPNGTEMKGLNFLNMMVDNHDRSCDYMSQYWIKCPSPCDSKTSTGTCYPNFDNAVPYANRLFGVWGINQPGWLIHDPGCSGKMFDFWKKNGIGVGVWEWWGEYPALNAFIEKIKQ